MSKQQQSLYRAAVRLSEDAAQIFDKFDNYTAKENLAIALRYLRDQANLSLTENVEELKRSDKTRARLQAVKSRSEYYLTRLKAAS